MRCGRRGGKLVANCVQLVWNQLISRNTRLFRAGPEIAQRILIVRGQRVLLDSDLAELYGVRTERLNQQVRRNRGRFPADFVFQLAINELRGNLLQNARGSRKHRDPRRPPIAFTEQGAFMAASVLSSPRAIEMSIYVVRAFIPPQSLGRSGLPQTSGKIANCELATRHQVSGGQGRRRLGNA